MSYIKGQTIEVGVGEFDEVTEEVNDGSSYYLHVDVERIEQDTVIDVFGKTENVLYVELVTDEDIIKSSKENLLSQYL